jgi:hypothetical protein
MAAAKADQALADWLEELPALAVAIDVDAPARRVLLEDAAADEALLGKASNASPVVRARAHLAHAAIQMLLADAGGGAGAADRSVEHVHRAVEIANTLAASGPRLLLLSQAGAVAAGAIDGQRATARRTTSRLLTEISEGIGEALAQQLDDAHRGEVTLAAALALADGVKAVRGKARIAVAGRASELATDARSDLIRAGELQKASLATDLIARLASVSG